MTEPEVWRPRVVAHLTTVDTSLRHLLHAQLAGARDAGSAVVGISAAGEDVAWLEERGFRHVELHGSTRSFAVRNDIRAVVSLWRILRDLRPDVLHTHNPKPGWYGRVVGRLAGVPVVVNTVHGLYATELDPPTRRFVVYALETIASRFSDAELLQNPEDHEFLVRTRLTARSKTTLLGNGVDLRRFRPGSSAQRTAAREAMGCRPEDYVVGFVGRLVAEKGLAELFEATEALPGVTLVVIGPTDPEKSDALGQDDLARAEERGVRFLGNRDDLEELYCGLDTLVLPSYREGFPRAAMEAAACAVPVVATDVRGCRQVVADGVNGLLVPVRDAASLRRAIERLRDDPATRERMGAASRVRAEEYFDEDDVVERVLASYPRARARRCHRVDRAKRAVDVVAGGAALVALSPLLAGTALGVRWKLGSPVLFRQERPGRDGRIFTINKFRSMTDERGPDGGLLSDEERLTRFGRFLRSASLDELPELWNVVRGDMSLVGPRPLLVRYLEQYSPEQARRHEVRPGLTGLAQVSGRNAQPWSERLACDVDYVDHRSLLLDAQILARTIRSVATRGGIAEDGHATKPFLGEDP